MIVIFLGSVISCDKKTMSSLSTDFSSLWILSYLFKKYTFHTYFNTLRIIGLL